MNTNTTTATKVGKGCGILFFILFALIGASFLSVLGISVVQDWQTRSWVPTPAVLLGASQELEKNQSDSGDKESVPYRYTYEGSTFTRDQVTRSNMKVNGRSSDTGEHLRSLPVGTAVTCYVNPAAPYEAVLELRSLTYAWFLLIPLIFLLIGIGGIIVIIRSKPSHMTAVSERSGGWKSNSKGSTFGLRVFGLMFMLIGGAATWFIAVKPMLAARAAMAWTAVPCRIDSATVESHRGNKGGYTYSIKVRYRFQLDGRKYVSERYDFSTGTSSGRDWREQAVAQLRADPSPVCFVNPADPNDSVLTRELGNERWFGLIPLVFVLVGAGVFLGASKMAGKKSGANALPHPAPQQQITSLAHGGYKLKPAVSPKTACIGMGCLALFWNSIVWLILLQPNIPVFARIFVSIFALIGLAMFGGFGYYLLALFNPKPTLTASEHSVPLGQSFQLKWRFSGNTSRIDRLEIVLTAKESATYRRGTSTTTDHNFFVHEKVFETRDRTNVSSGELTITIPHESMHSFDSGNNKITWTVQLNGDIAKWPDVKMEFPITVVPNSL